jgi:hypothetical protein
MRNITMKMLIDREHEYDSFEEIGMTDPHKKFKESLEDAISICRTFDFYTEIYPQALIEAMMLAVHTQDCI